MPEITKQWITENGEGHWLVSCGDYAVSCDDSELSDTIREIQAAVA